MVQVSRKIILSLSERLSNVSESVLFAFFLCLDYIRSNRPAYVAVKKKKKKMLRVCMVCFSVSVVFEKILCRYMHFSLILVSGDCFDFP